MLGVVRNLYDTFLNGYFDAETSRIAYVASSIIQNLKSINILGNPIIINFYKEIKNHPNYLMADNIRLTKNGNNVLNKMLGDYLNKKVIN